MVKLTRKQELALINIGLLSVISNLIPAAKTKPVKKSKKWGKDQHKKFANTMAKKWTKANKEERARMDAKRKRNESSK